MPTRFDPREGLLIDATEIIRRPSPELGWSGDTDLFVVYNRLEDRWEIWRENGQDEYQLIGRQREPGQKLDPARIIRGLVERDTTLRGNSHQAQMERLIEDNVKLEEARERAMQEEMAETMTKVAHAIVTQDESAHHSYVRPMTIGAEFDRVKTTRIDD